MKITKEISIEEFEGWSGAENTLDKKELEEYDA